jgi:hypothetical protein
MVRSPEGTFDLPPSPLWLSCFAKREPLSRFFVSALLESVNTRSYSPPLMIRLREASCLKAQQIQELHHRLLKT